MIEIIKKALTITSEIRFSLENRKGYGSKTMDCGYIKQSEVWVLLLSLVKSNY